MTDSSTTRAQVDVADATTRDRSVAHSAHPLTARLVLFAVSFAFWLLLVWPVTPDGDGLLWGDIAAGAVAAALVALIMRDFVTGEFARLLNPVRYFWFAIYQFVFAYYVVRASIDVAYRVLHPALPIRPGIVRVKSQLRSATARTVLANSITLTPGTLTLDITDDGTFYVHWINVSTRDERQAAAQILGRFEWFIRRVFE